MASFDDSGGRTLLELQSYLLRTSPLNQTSSCGPFERHADRPPALQPIKASSEQTPSTPETASKPNDNLSAQRLSSIHSGQMASAPPADSMGTSLEHDDSAGFDGDTQVMPSQVYKDYQSGLGHSLNNLQEGDNGHVDLVTLLASQDPANDEISMRHDPLDTDTQDLLSSALKRPTLPKTPAVIGEKGDRRGYATSLGPTSVTPGSALSNILGTVKLPQITNSQLFNMTQEMSSPLNQDVQSDPGDTRPSPTFATNHITSPMSVFQRTMSSPAKGVEPEDLYTSMVESQRNRYTSIVDPRKTGRGPTKVVFDAEDDLVLDQARDRVGMLNGASSVKKLSATTQRPTHGDSRVSRGSSGRRRTYSRRRKGPEIIDISDDVASGSQGSLEDYDDLGQDSRLKKMPLATKDSPCSSPTPSTRQHESRIISTDREDNQTNARRENMTLSSLVQDSQPSSNSLASEKRSQAQARVSTVHPSEHVNGFGHDSNQSSHLPPGSQAARVAFSSDLKSTPPVPESSHEAPNLPQRSGTIPACVIANIPQESGAAQMPNSLVKVPNPSDNHAEGAARSRESSKRQLSNSYNTAKSQLSRPLTLSQAAAVESPRKAAGVGKMADIAFDSSPLDPISIEGVITADDVEFLKVMEPPPKRPSRVTTYGKRKAKSRAPSAKQTAVSGLDARPNEALPITEMPTCEQTSLETAQLVSDVVNMSSSDDISTLAAPKIIGSTTLVGRKRKASPNMSLEHEPRKRPTNPAKSAARTRRVSDGRAETSQHITIDASETDSNFQKRNLVHIADRPPSPHAPPVGHVAVEPVLPEASLIDERYRHRVLALFKGNMAGYFPALCLAMSDTVHGGKCTVRFDDGIEAKLEPHLVCKFDLRPGDVVKVDSKELRTKTFVLVELSKSSSHITATDMQTTDVYGNTDVQLALKPRANIGTTVLDQLDQENLYSVKLANIYLTPTMWQKYSDRAYSNIGHLMGVASRRLKTPTYESSASGTPRSRSRRQTLHSVTEGAAKTHGTACRSDVFHGMLFAITLQKPDDVKEDIIDQIVSNGGRLIGSGFQELFQEFKDPTTQTAIADGAEPITKLTLSERVKSVGFVALIADKHSRRAKYIQALALGLPCLSYRWVIDSVRAKRLEEWRHYLLPAGDSKYLDATLSRTLALTALAQTTLAQMVAKRHRLLTAGGVLLISSGRAADDDKGQVFAFLSLALGAERVRIVSSLEAAAKTLNDEPDLWHWIHHDSKSEATLQSQLQIQAQGGRRKSRDSRSKAGEEPSWMRLFGTIIGHGEFGLSTITQRCRFVTDEFVIQSLILGKLIER